MSTKGRVLVAMSGGIDSTVTAMMLHDQGYEVVGLTMKTWDYQSSGGGKKETGCCSLDSINDAREMAVQRGFHHIILDIREEFGESIIDNFVEEYMAGRTPNPCVLCNTHIKWEALLKRADMLDCKYIATGHYASIRKENNRYVVSKGVDNTKDQSYVLWGLSQESLSRTILPLGQYRKSEIKKMALKEGLHELVKKPESYEICFIPDNDYRGFLKRRIPNLEKEVEGGHFINSKEEVIGTHNGYPFYTIGQRKGLGLAFGDPMYVTEIRPKTNEVMLGPKEDLDKQIMYVRDLNLIKLSKIPKDIEVQTKIRYKHSGEWSTLSFLDKNTLKVEFHKKVEGIAPGQSAVFYLDDDVLGGGRICREDEINTPA